MPCNHPCKTVETRSTGSKVQFQKQDGPSWLKSNVPSGSSGINVNNVPIGKFVRSEQSEAESNAIALQQPYPPFESCPKDCPCTGIETKRPIAPKFTSWKEVPAGYESYRYRFQIDREIVFVEGLCIEMPQVDDFEESEYAMFSDTPVETGEFSLAFLRLTETLDRVENTLTKYESRISKLERSGC